MGMTVSPSLYRKTKAEGVWECGYILAYEEGSNRRLEKLYEDLYDLYFSLNIITVTISRRSWAGHVVCMRE